MTSSVKSSSCVGREEVVGALAVLEPEDVRAVLGPPAGRLVGLLGQQRREVDLLRAGRRHLLADDGLDLGAAPAAPAAARCRCPGAARRMYPARTSRRWLATSASAGSSRSVRTNRVDIRSSMRASLMARRSGAGAARAGCATHGHMPELPEVEALAGFLRERTVGVAVAGVDVGAISALKTFAPAPTDLVGHLVTDVARHGKWLDLVTVPADGGRRPTARCTWSSTSRARGGCGGTTPCPTTAVRARPLPHRAAGAARRRRRASTSPRPARASGWRCTWCATRRRSPRSRRLGVEPLSAEFTPAAVRRSCSPRATSRSRPCCATSRRSPGSATPTPTRSCTPRGRARSR